MKDVYSRFVVTPLSVIQRLFLAHRFSKKTIVIVGIFVVVVVIIVIYEIPVFDYAALFPRWTKRSGGRGGGG